MKYIRFVFLIDDRNSQFLILMYKFKNSLIQICIFLYFYAFQKYLASSHLQMVSCLLIL